MKSITLSDIRNLRKYYKNYGEIIFLHAIGRIPRNVVLRNDVKLDLSECGNFQFVALSRLMAKGWNVILAEKGRIALHCRSNGLTLICRYDQGGDVHNLAETFADETYGNSFQDKVVVDIGMSNAESSIFFANKGAKLVIGLEPFGPSYDVATENILMNNLQTKIIPVKAALSGVSGTRELTVSNSNPNVCSLEPLPQLKAKYAFESKETVKTISLEDLMIEFKLQTIDLLKMDCEGSEYEILRNLSPALMTKVSEIVLEFHGGPRDLPLILGRNGFNVNHEDKTIGYLRAWR